MIEEKWRKVTDWELYEVSNFGRIRNSKTGILKKSRANNRGYLLIQFEIKDRKNTFLVHRIVAEAFCKKKENDKIVNHIDGNKLNNNSSNLEWCNQSHNIKEAIRLGNFNPVKAGLKGLKKRWGYE